MQSTNGTGVGPGPGVAAGTTGITVFGSARVKPGDADYEASVALGRALAERGFTAITGGYNGVMEAVSRGAKEAGGQTIGVTVDILARTASPNDWLDQEIRTAALLERIDRLIELGAGYVIMPGGAGTLAEFGVVWNLGMLGALHGKPIVVVGSGWREVLQTLTTHLHAGQPDLAPLTFVDTPEEAARVLAERLAPAPVTA